MGTQAAHQAEQGTAHRLGALVGGVGVGGGRAKEVELPPTLSQSTGRQNELQTC